MYHPRLPVVNPTRFRAQFRAALAPASSTPSTTTPPASHEVSFQRGVSRENPTAPSSTSPSQPNKDQKDKNGAAVKDIHRPLLATLLAWGSKFSDHPLLVYDRQMAAQEDAKANGTPQGLQRSRISQLLVDRAREVAEQERVYRLPKVENVVVCLLLEPLQPLLSCAYPLLLSFALAAGHRA